jgi:hypothetical protein
MTILPEAARWALVVMLTALGFAGVLLSTLLNFSDARRLTLSAVVRDRASMFRIRCADGLVCRQWSDQ